MWTKGYHGFDPQLLGWSRLEVISKQAWGPGWRRQDVPGMIYGAWLYIEGTRLTEHPSIVIYIMYVYNLYIYLYIYISYIYISTYLSINISIYLYIYISIYQYIYVSTYILSPVETDFSGSRRRWWSSTVWAIPARRQRKPRPWRWEEDAVKMPREWGTFIDK